MKDPSDNIRDYVYNVLYGTVSYGGSYVPVYSFAPKDATYPHIVIGEQQMLTEEPSPKDDWITEHSVTIEIWDSYSGNDASYVKVNTIANSVTQLLRTRTMTLSGSGGQTIAGITGFNLISLTVENMITDRFLWDNQIVIYKSLNIKLVLEEE